MLVSMAIDWLVWVAIGWLVLVGASGAWAGVRGAATYRRARAAQVALEAQSASLRDGGLVALAERQAELQRKVEELRAALDRLSRSMNVLRSLLTAWTKATAPAVAVLRFLRR
jgi:cell division protein FtsB